jgi:hypothetical protein
MERPSTPTAERETQDMRDAMDAETGPETTAPTSAAQLSTADIAGADRPRSDTAPAVRAAPADATAQTAAAAEDDQVALFDPAMARGYQERWQDIQVKFVDAPRDAVEKADALVAEVMQQLAKSFARERKDLEGRWSGGEGSSTEELRQAIRRYRSFFNRLLAI